MWHTRYKINTRTSHTIYLNSLSTTGQKILERLQDHSTNTRPPWLTLLKAALKSIWTSASSPPLSNSIWPEQTMSRRASQPTGTQILPVWVLVRWQDHRSLQKATKMQRVQPFENFWQNWCNQNRPIVADKCQ